MNPINLIRVHVFLVTRGVVTHYVHHNGGMIPSCAHVEVRMSSVAVVLVGGRGFPIIVAKMRLREPNEHSHFIGGSENLRETQMRAGLATVVVGVNVVDPKTLEAFEALADTLVGRQCGADLRIVERNGRKENACAVEVKITPLDPELAKAKPLRPTGVQQLTAFIEE